MTSVRVGPKDPQATHQISLSDGAEQWGIALQEGARSVNEGPTSPTNIRATQGGTKYGDFDPSFSHIEMRDWTGGRGLDDFNDDPSRYYDAANCNTLTDGRIFQALQWNVSSGMRVDVRNLPGSVHWKPLIGAERWVASSFSPSTTFNIANGYLWVRRVGTPGALTFELRSSAAAGAAKPGAVFETVGAGCSNITDTPSVYHKFVCSSAPAGASGAKDWVAISGTTGDNQENHWEVGINSTVAGSLYGSADATTWVASSGQLYFRLTDADRARKFHMFNLPSSASSSRVFAVSQHDNGSSVSQLYYLSTGTAQWSLITASAALTGVVEDVAVMDNMALFARGPSTAYPIGVFRRAGSSNEIYYLSDKTADRLYMFSDPTDGPQIWRANSSAATVSYSDTFDWGSSPSFSPSTNIPVGHKGSKIVEIGGYNDSIVVRKQDGLFSVKNKRAAMYPVGLDMVWETRDQAPLQSVNLYLYIPWSHSLERMYGGTLDDIGPWKGTGMPSSRAGPIADMVPGIGPLYAAIDAGTTGVSSVLAWNERGWHEIFRAPVAGMRVQNLFWDSNPNGNPRLWIGCGGELYYLNMPKNAINPLQDASMRYMHEGVVETAMIDMGVAQLPKLFHEIHCISKGLASSGGSVCVDYQLDDDVGSTSWTVAGRFMHSPTDVVPIRRGDKQRIRLRFRMLTNDAATPTEVKAFVLKSVARTPVKRQWDVRCRSGTFQVTALGLPDHAPDDFYLWLHDAAITTKPLHMRSVWSVMDDMWVYAEAPIMTREYTTPSGEWGGIFHIVLKEI